MVLLHVLKPTSRSMRVLGHGESKRSVSPSDSGNASSYQLGYAETHPRRREVLANYGLGSGSIFGSIFGSLGSRPHALFAAPRATSACIKKFPRSMFTAF